MTSAINNNKRIIKNASLLYVRLGLTIIIGFITTRKILQALGVIDYGLVNVIGGVVTMFSFLSGTMSLASSRFFNFELGQGNQKKLKQIFNLTQLIYIGLLIILLILAETVGLWLVNHKVVVPVERMGAALWFFHFSVIAFLSNMALVPYQALVLAHENMKAFAWICMGESIAKLGIAYLLIFITSNLDHLVLYGAFWCLLAIALFLGYYIICHYNYPESKFSFYWDPKLFQEILSFSSWNLFGAVAGLFSNVLVNLLLNNFFGPAVNAARGVALQLSTAIASFGQNFMTAVNPQIIKYYAAHDIEQVHILAMRASRLGYLLILFIGLPAIFEMEFVLKTWLGVIPAHTILFAQLMIVRILIETFSYPLLTVAQASGRVALYQVVVGVTIWLNLPLSYYILKLGAPPEATVLIAISLGIICLILRLFLVHRCSGLAIHKFLRNVLIRSGLVTLIAPIFPYLAEYFLEPTWERFLLVCVLCVISVGLCSLFVGLSHDERKGIILAIKDKLKILWPTSEAPTRI